ncbi:MAG TPA: response regulator [Gammaproteobacteria bacterium]|nr:response regulator [Gammaproteobacteria bacterium]
MKREHPLSEILLVDDDPVIRLAIGEGIRNERFRINTARDGKEAIAACEKLRFDLAIIDQELPDTSGLELAKRLKFEFGIPFIFLTASDDFQTVSAASQLGALGYLVKPLTPSQVSAEIEASLSRSREIYNLGRAVHVSGIVSVALGLVMHSQGICRDDALALLHGICRPRNQSLKQLSEQIVDAYEEYVQTRLATGMEPELTALLKLP